MKVIPLWDAKISETYVIYSTKEKNYRIDFGELLKIDGMESVYLAQDEGMLKKQNISSGDNVQFGLV